MIKIVSKFSNHKNLLENFFSLVILQGGNYLLPLLTLPYLVRILGVSNFGLLAFATATITYFNIITDYGFNLTATRQISIHRSDRNKLNEIFSSIMFLKFGLMIISLFFLTILVFFIDKFYMNKLVYFLTFGTVLGQFLFPVWFFQGLERMKYITYLNLFSKVVFTLPIFILVKTPDDFLYVPLLTSLGMIVAGLISLYIVFNKFNIKLKLQKKKVMYEYLKESHFIFISNISVTLYTMSTVLILGFFTSNIIVGYYTIANKLIESIKLLISPISQALFPFVSKKSFDSKKKTLEIVYKLFIILVPISFLIATMLFIFTPELLYLIFGNKAANSILVFRILAIVPTLVVIDTLFGSLTMLVFNKNKHYSKIILFAGLLNLVLIFVLIPKFQHVGAAISVLIVELFITTQLVLYCVRNNLNIFKWYSYES